MVEQIRLITYFAFLIVFFAITFKVLRALHIETKFKKNHIWEIKVAYIIISLVVAHLLSEIILKAFDWINLIINKVGG